MIWRASTDDAWFEIKQRYGLNNLFEFDGSSIGALLWSQGISGAIFGLVLGKREDLATLYVPPSLTELRLL